MIDVKFLLTVPVQTDHENEVTEIWLDNYKKQGGQCC